MININLLKLFLEAKTTRLLVAAAVLVHCIAISWLYIRKILGTAPPQVDDNPPIIGALDYWARRWSWWRTEPDQSETGNLTFHAGGKMVVADAGDKRRRLFLEAKSLRFEEGYAMLFELSFKDAVDAVSVQRTVDFSSWFGRRLTSVLKKASIHGFFGWGAGRHPCLGDSERGSYDIINM